MSRAGLGRHPKVGTRVESSTAPPDGTVVPSGGLRPAGVTARSASTYAAPPGRALVQRFPDAFDAGDIDGLVAQTAGLLVRTLHGEKVAALTCFTTPGPWRFSGSPGPAPTSRPCTVRHLACARLQALGPKRRCRGRCARLARAALRPHLCGGAGRRRCNSRWG